MLPKKADHQVCVQKANALEKLWWELYLKLSFKMEKRSLVFNLFCLQEFTQQDGSVFQQTAKHSFHKPTQNNFKVVFK